MFQFEFDDNEGILALRISGTWTAAEVHRLAREIRPQFLEARRKAGALRFLIDKRPGEVIPPGMAEPLVTAGARHGKEDDRIAVLVSSSLDKSLSRQVFNHERVATFVSENAARTWLMALVQPGDLGRTGTD